MSMKQHFAAPIRNLFLSFLTISALVGASNAQHLAHLAPADTGLYVELSDGTDLLLGLTEPKRWAALAEFAGQPATGSDAQSWRKRVEETVGVSPEQAIRTLFANGVAFVGAGPFRAQDPVLLCRPARSAALPELLRQWDAQSYADPELASVFRLKNQLGVTVFGDALMFGSPATATGTFKHALQAQQTGPAQSLAATPEFQALLKRLPPEPDGLFFVRTRSGRFEETAQRLPAPIALLSMLLPNQLRHAQAWMVAMHRSGEMLRFTTVGHTDSTQPSATLSQPENASQLQLPANTLAAWNGHVDFADLLLPLDQLPEQHLLRLALPQQAADIAGDLFTGSATVAFAALPPVDPASPPTPALALVLETREPESALGFADGVAGLGKVVYDTYAANNAMVPLPAIDNTHNDPNAIRTLDLTDQFNSRFVAIFGNVQLCWKLVGRQLIIATEPVWLEQIGAKLANSADLVINDSALPADSLTQAPAMSIVCRGHELAQLGNAWLKHLKRLDPELMTEAWWRDHQPTNARPRLGITVSTVRQGNALRIDSVDSGSNAEGVLIPGDLILGCNGEAFSGAARRVIARGIIERPHARWIDLIVERDEQPITIRVPLPFVNPVRLLEKSVALGQIIGDVVYIEESGSQGYPRGILTVVWRDQNPSHQPESR
jgi:hypothetical protein